MARLIYTAITSLDGYVADKNGNFDWATPDEEVHRFINDLERRARTYLYGRRMYEVMAFWEAAHTLGDQLAGGRQDRVLQDAKGGDHRQDADRARVRRRRGPEDESASRA